MLRLFDFIGFNSKSANVKQVVESVDFAFACVRWAGSDALHRGLGYGHGYYKSSR